ncbi:MAG: thioesterase domain-containing protein [Gammaproteobacteria bacterium]|nr:thioesterase domain-containing protein [Gammaproteobacteria bacterium]MDH5653934.1 thioesterase domain-containing protein [Gammaproteobacteria bacterium]
MPAITLHDLQNKLHEQIPLTKTIGIRVTDYSGETLTLSAPLQNNINHKSTAFGGSLYSVAVLAGWGLLYTKLNELDLSGHIVIQQSNVNYLQPVKSDIIATCSVGDITTFERFIRTFNKKGMARIKLASVIMQGDEAAVEFEGSYVVHV